MPPWQSWHLGLLLVGLYILLLTSLFAQLIATLLGYDLIFFTRFKDAGFNVAIIAMIGVLLVPFLRLIDNASHTRTLVTGIYENVSQFNSPVASFTSHQTLTHLLAAVHTYDAPLIFLGFKDRDMVRNLLSILQSKKRGALYIHPRVLESLLDVIDLQDTTLGQMVYVTDCPRESCAVFGIDHFGKMSCILFRYLPRQIVSTLDANWWSATLNPGTSYPEYLYNTYDRHYRGESATLLRFSLKARLLLEVNARRIAQNRLLNADHFAVATRVVAYSYATSLLRHAQRSILAVDFISPGLWTESYGIIYDYVQAHLRPFETNMTRIRVHCFKEGRLAKDAAGYVEFIRLNKEMNFELRFIEQSLARQRGIHRGFVIVDEQMVFSAEESNIVRNEEFFLPEDVDNVKSVDSGFFDFRHEEVSRYRSLFDKLIRMDERVLMTATQFEGLIKQFVRHTEEVTQNH